MKINASINRFLYFFPYTKFSSTSVSSILSTLVDYLLPIQLYISREWGDWLYFCIAAWFKMLWKELIFKFGICYYDIK